MDFYIKGFATHADANNAKNQLLEDVTLDENEAFSIDCYILKTGEMRYAVTIVPVRGLPPPSEAEIAEARAEYLEDR
jgi:hypothetical protein